VNGWRRIDRRGGVSPPGAVSGGAWLDGGTPPLPCLPHLRQIDSVAHIAVAATVVDRLVGEARVIFAVGEAVEVAMAAEVETLCAGIADRPFAHLVVQRDEGHIQADRHDKILDRYWVGRAPWRRLGMNLEGSVAGDIGARMARRRGGRQENRGPVAAGLARPERLNRCTLPITALRLTPPSWVAIWLALSPSLHSFFNNSTRSSVHDIAA